MLNPFPVRNSLMFLFITSDFHIGSQETKYFLKSQKIDNHSKWDKIYDVKYIDMYSYKQCLET